MQKSEKGEAAVKLAELVMCDDPYYGSSYMPDDIEAERKQWQKAIAKADKSGYARAKKEYGGVDWCEGCEARTEWCINHNQPQRDKHPQKRKEAQNANQK
jgi:hypothetical protein